MQTRPLILLSCSDLLVKRLGWVRLLMTLWMAMRFLLLHWLNRRRLLLIVEKMQNLEDYQECRSPFYRRHPGRGRISPLVPTRLIAC
jgi:hypothetical protein